ncbi:uncharacterized protein GGS22DRAFT_194561 [Annulohypoxylon maeteangense]|uniref:uncharacterized protein n=1 Tax=Annulohypoxylon maeteangense TaxID=1927788 RepID=UPI0020074FF0|nr:uncharacterized protein GGS22DRAFT_194561 [Annulohypoxylon maeteangense]KAI0890591.1 hypothetical protein GGS22DRAFT_194561 [Annulohypoxylon maeteangense]
MATVSPTPALQPPPGVASNFVNPESLAGKNNIAMGVSIPLITISFFLRVYVRIWIRRTWVFEDWLALTAWASTVSLAGVGTATMAHNGGKHGYDITHEQFQEALYWFNATTINYGIAICTTKLAVLWYYRRVFSPFRRKPFDISIVCLITVLILFYGSTTIVKIWECIPRERIWDKSIPGRCISTDILLDTSGLFNTLTDFIMLLLPVKAVWKLKLKVKQKVLVVGVFTFGLCAPVFSLVGFIVRLQGNNNPDKSWIQPKIIMWGLAETTTGMLCVSFPELGPLIRRRQSPTHTESIVNSNYRSGDKPYPRQGSRFSTAISQGVMKLESDPYIELDERDVYPTQYAAQADRNIHDREPRPGEITVTQEVTVDSHRREEGVHIDR